VLGVCVCALGSTYGICSMLDIHTHMCVTRCTYTYIHIYICIYVYTHTYDDMYIYVYIYTLHI